MSKLVAPTPKPAKKVEVFNPDDIPTKVIADAIVKISDATSALLKSGLNRDALVVLIKAETRLNSTQINDVLNCLRDLRELYTTRK